MRKKLLLGALIGAVALAAAAVAIASPQLTQSADVDLSTKKTGKPTGVVANLVENDPGATPPGNFPASIKVVIQFPTGTRANSSAAPQCNLSSTDVANNECPANTVLGSGSALANVVLGPQGPVIQDVNAAVTAYNRKGAIAFRVVSEATTSLPSVTIPIIGTLSKKGKLTVPVPILHPAGETSKVILTQFKVTIKKKSKTVGRGRKRHKIYLLRTPKTCSGTWKTTADFTFDDGDTRHVESTQSCTRP